MKTEPASPVVRLAFANGQAERPGNGTFDSPSVRLAINGSGQGETNGALAAGDRPALLVSYVYLAPFLKNRHRYHYRDWVLDSGAFSAHNSGREIKLQDYIDTCKRLMAEDPTLSEIFALDVIGDWKASLKNVEAMWKQGVPAIPCYHIGEPESVLKGLARDYPKIALGGVALAKPKVKTDFAAQCFARVWPKPIHGFGYGHESHILAFPWHSVDATNWEVGPCKFGRWKSYGQMSVKGSKQNLRSEVEWYLKLEQRARERWKREMARLAGMTLPLSVRLASQQMCESQIKRSGLEVPPPSMRLAYAETGINGSIKIDKALGRPQ